ncbi:cupin domain-containing protein [Acidocella sp.]|uniref:cupin domain-containing protein n=1 Tax=Acidocella sp. TaxID=50710 RepID=UPI002628E496|nr:cupin domain-containing protein [Acidocella sp.]
MKKADISEAAARTGASSYPPPYDEPLKGRKTWMLTKQFGLMQFGVNRVELPPGGWSTQRHWHKTNDEVVIVISGELTLVTDDGEELLRAGDCTGFKAGDRNAHHMQNRGTEPAIYYDIGGRDSWDVSTFPDMGLEARMMMQLQFKPIKK